MSERWLNLVDAAGALGTTPEAVRMRAKRGTLESEKRPDGRLYVRIGDDYTESEQHRAGGQDRELIEQLRSEVEYLRYENRRKDTIIMQMAQRLPELEAPDNHGEESYDGGGHESPKEPPQRDESTSEGYTSSESTPEPQTATQRPWWKRLFGG